MRVARPAQAATAMIAAIGLCIPACVNPPLGSGQAHPVAELGERFDAPYAKVGGLARSDAADLLVEAEGASGVDCHSGDCFLRSQAEQGARHVHRQRRRKQRRGTWVAVRSDSDWDLVLAQ